VRPGVWSEGGGGVRKEKKRRWKVKGAMGYVRGRGGSLAVRSAGRVRGARLRGRRGRNIPRRRRGEFRASSCRFHLEKGEETGHHQRGVLVHVLVVCSATVMEDKCVHG